MDTFKRMHNDFNYTFQKKLSPKTTLCRYLQVKPVLLEQFRGRQELMLLPLLHLLQITHQPMLNGRPLKIMHRFHPQ